MLRPGIRRIFRLIGRRRELIERDVSAEIDTHLALREEQLIARGFSATDARAEARRRFGAYDIDHGVLAGAAHDREQRMRIAEWLDSVRQDSVYAIRALRREPILTTFVILTFALGIGANAAMFGVVDHLLLRGPAHVLDPGRVMRVYETVLPRGQKPVNMGTFGYATYDALRTGATTLGGVAAFTAGERSVVFGEGPDAELINLGESTPDFFPVLGTRAHIGRFYNAAEDAPAAPQRVVVLGYGLWKQRFGGDTSIIGKSVMINFASFTVIGVAPQGFTGPDMFRVDAWVPLSLLSPRSIPDWPKTWYTQWHQIVVRLKPGVRPADAAADINTAYHRAYTGEDSLQMRATMRIAPIRFGTDGDEPAEVGVTRWLVGVAAVMLLIGCANIVNLLLARAVRRKREVAVRLALGVRRARLVRMLLTESAVLALAGWGAGLGVAYGAGSLIRTVLLPSVDWTVSPVSGRVLVVSLLVTLIAGTCVGLVPALQSSRIDLNAALKASARDGGGRTSKIRGTLTVAQAALSVLLLIGAGLFVRSLRHVNAIDLGIEPDRVLTVGLRRSAAANAGDSIAQRLEAARRVNFLPEAVRRLRAVPLVETATLAIGMPFRGRYSLVLKVSGRDSIPPTPGGSPTVSAIGDDYFRAVGQRLLRGRLFTPADRAGSELVAIVNEEMARTLWPGRDAIGECIRYGSKQLDTVPCSRVVGVVANAHLVRLQEPVRMQYYVPFGQEHGMTGTTLIVRPRGDVGAAKRAIERELRLMDSSLGFIDMRVLQETIDPQVRPWRLGATMFTLMGLLALIVAAVGLYSVMAYLVVQRTHEIGVRSALGASAADIVALILKGGLSLAAIGVGLGVVAALALGRFIAPLLFQTSPRDGLVFTVVAASLLTVAVLATAIPAWRAKRVSPLQALRSD